MSAQREFIDDEGVKVGAHDEETKLDLRQRYDAAIRERDIAERKLAEAQRKMMRAWYDLRDATEDVG